MATDTPITAPTMDADSNSSNSNNNNNNTNEYTSYPRPSRNTDNEVADVDEGFSTEDEEPLFLRRSNPGSTKFSPGGVKADEDDAHDEEGSSIDDESMEDEPVEVIEVEPSRCKFMGTCNTGCRAYRKVVSHILGRNKKCTTQIPEECWIEFCRKHYQRTKYRTSKSDSKSYCMVQLDLLSRQLSRLKAWGGVQTWEIAIRKKERDVLKQEDDELRRRRESGSGVNQLVHNAVQNCKERVLRRFVGTRKSYNDVERLLHFIEQEVANDTFDKFPGIELLPEIDPIAYPPRSEIKAVKKAEDGDEPESSKVKGSKGKKPQLLKRSSSTPARILKPKVKKEQTMKTRRLVRAAERHIKLEADTDSTPVPGSLSTTSQASSPVMLPKKGYFSTAATRFSSTPATASSSSSHVRHIQPAMPLHKKGTAYPRPSTPRTPLPPPEPRRVAPPAASSSSYRSGFRPVNLSNREVLYRPATPQTPAGNVSPSPQPQAQTRSSRVDTSRDVVFVRCVPSAE